MSPTVSVAADDVRATVPPTFSVPADTLTERLATVCVEVVVAVGAIGEGLEPESPQPLHRATTTARQAAWRAGMTALSPGISVLPTPDGTFIHPRAAEPRSFLRRTIVQLQRPSPSARADVRPTGAAAFRVFLRHRSTLMLFRRQADFVALAARQPLGTGSAQILRSMSPNSPRVRCPSASRSQ